MYIYARVCLFGPCYSARVSATLPLVEEGKSKIYKRPVGRHTLPPRLRRGHTTLRRRTPPSAAPLLRSPTPPRRSRPPPCSTRTPCPSPARPRRPHSDSECPPPASWRRPRPHSESDCPPPRRGAAPAPSWPPPLLCDEPALLSCYRRSVFLSKASRRAGPPAQPLRSPRQPPRPLRHPPLLDCSKSSRQCSLTYLLTYLPLLGFGAMRVTRVYACCTPTPRER